MMFGHCKQCTFCRDQNGKTFSEVMAKLGKSKTVSIYSIRLCCRVKVPAFLSRKVEEIPLVPWLYPGLNIDDVKAGLCGCERFKE